MWRVYSNAIPTGDNLRKRGLVVSDVCYVCGSMGESVLHTLSLCHFTQQVWADAGFGAIVRIQAVDILTWMEDCRLSLKEGDESLFVVLCWALWNNRNNFMHSNVTRSPVDIV